MKKSRGPAKILAPALACENVCKHEFTGAEGLQLEVDCEACPGAQDLESRGCMMGLMNVVAQGAVPDTVILKRFMHMRYRGEAVRTIAAAASELSALTRALRCASTVSDRKCRTCSCNRTRLATHLRTLLLDDPGRYVRSPGTAESALDEAVRGAACERGEECASRVRALRAPTGRRA